MSDISINISSSAEIKKIIDEIKTKIEKNIKEIYSDISSLKKEREETVKLFHGIGIFNEKSSNETLVDYAIHSISSHYKKIIKIINMYIGEENSYLQQFIEEKKKTENEVRQNIQKILNS